MNEQIVNKIEALPPLPKTIIELEEFRKKQNKEINELLTIVEKDALIVSTLLKIVNSAMFGFRTKVETPNRAVNLLGINFTISVAIGGSIQNLLKTSLKPYGITSDDFMKASNIASTLATFWLSKIEVENQDDIILASLLQETGKFIIASIINNEGKAEAFLQMIEDSSILQAENSFLNTNTSKVTAQIFRHWKLSENLINCIDSLDNLESVEHEFKQRVEILNVIRAASNVLEPLSDESIGKAIDLAKSFKLDTATLLQSIEELKEKLAKDELL